MPKYSKSGYDLTPLSRERVAEICETLTPEQVRVTQAGATEPAFCGRFTEQTKPGIYVSVVGGLPLFRSSAKFPSDSGWAGFSEPFDPEHIEERVDRNQEALRVEVRDARSGAHLGHVFDDGPPPSGKRYCINSAALAFIPQGKPLPPESQPVESQTACFAGGCFWGVEYRFAQVPGVIDAVAGYQGGDVSNPGYMQVRSGKTGHAETVKVVFDPATVTYRELLEVFFDLHDPTTPDRQGADVGTQYRSVIFALSDDQAQAARDFIRKLEISGEYGERPIVTAVEEAPPFYPAEEYHQDYYDKRGGACRS